jgi:hypothetical protein
MTLSGAESVVLGLILLVVGLMVLLGLLALAAALRIWVAIGVTGYGLMQQWAVGEPINAVPVLWGVGVFLALSFIRLIFEIGREGGAVDDEGAAARSSSDRGEPGWVAAQRSSDRAVSANTQRIQRETYFRR